jgi:hypothetical protein
MSIHRRPFLKSAAAAIPAAALSDLIAQAPASAPTAAAVHVVGAGQDVPGHIHSLGFSSLAFKVDPTETGDGLFIIEHRNLMPGTGPALHLHPRRN